MLNLTHLNAMTTPHGILQFSLGSCPDQQSGYTLDDNARALMLMILLGTPRARALAMKYLGYLERARQGNHWYNLLQQGYRGDYDSEDSIGRALLSCSLGARAPWKAIRQKAAHLFEQSLYLALNFNSPRGIAYTLLALGKHPNASSALYTRTIHSLGQTLTAYYKYSAQPGWLWFEAKMSYCNAVLPHALLIAYDITRNPEFQKIGQDTLRFLLDILFRHGHLNIIGNQSWLKAGESPGLFDQQPVDAASIAFAAYDAYLILNQAEYLTYAKKACGWFSGDNIHRLALYDTSTGGCFDALTADGVNGNQGAESLLAMLGSLYLEQKMSTKLKADIHEQNA